MSDHEQGLFVDGAGEDAPARFRPNESDWTYVEDGVPVYRAYIIGGCIRSLTASRMGETAYPPGERMQKVFDESSAAEDDAIAEYEKRTGHHVIWRQRTVELRVFTEVGKELVAIVRGHVDGLDQEEDCLVEVKALSGRNFALFDNGGLDALPGGLGLKYRWQKATYGYAAARKIKLVVFNKHAEGEEDLLIIEPAVAPGDFGVTLDEISDRVRKIEGYYEEDRYPDCDRGCKKGDAYSHIHVLQGTKLVEDGDLERDLARLHELNQLIGSEGRDGKPGKGLLGERQEIKEFIKQEYGAGKLTVGAFNLNVFEKNTSHFNQTAHKKAHPECHDEFMVPGKALQINLTKMSEGTDANVE